MSVTAKLSFIEKMKKTNAEKYAHISIKIGLYVWAVRSTDQGEDIHKNTLLVWICFNSKRIYLKKFDIEFLTHLITTFSILRICEK